VAEQFDFPWRNKGGRDYLHATDMHDLVCQALIDAGYPPLRQIDMTVHRVAREGLTGVLADAPAASREAAAVFQFSAGDRKLVLSLLPNGEPITRRDPYPEDEIAAACRIDLDARRVELGHLAGFSTIEKIVAMNKLLLQRLFPEADGKWFFAKLKLNESLWGRELPSLQLRFETHLDFTLTRTAITADGESLGRIFFSLVKAAAA
jgi:hypothetical protein